MPNDDAAEQYRLYAGLEVGHTDVENKAKGKPVDVEAINAPAETVGTPPETGYEETPRSAADSDKPKPAKKAPAKKAPAKKAAAKKTAAKK